EVDFVYSKTGTAELASDPMPPNLSDTFIILKPSTQWRSEAELDRLIAQKTLEVEATGGHAEHADEGQDEQGERHHGHDEMKTEGHKGKVIKVLELTLRTLPGN